MEGELNMIAIKFGYVSLLIIIFMGILFWMRKRYQLLSKTHLIVEFIPPAGRGWMEMVKREGDSFRVESKEGKSGKKVGRTYMVGKIATYSMLYPDVPKWLFFLSILQCEFSKMVVDSESWEPISNRAGKLLLDPRRLDNVKRQDFTRLGVEMAQDELKERRKVAGKSGGFSFSTVIIILLVLAFVVGGYWVMQNMDMLKAATGVP